MAAETLLSFGSSFWEARWEDEDEIPRLKRSVLLVENMGLTHIYFEAVLAVRAPVLNWGSILIVCEHAQLVGNVLGCTIVLFSRNGIREEACALNAHELVASPGKSGSYALG